MKLNVLNDVEKQVIVNKGTEPPFTGEYDDFFEGGIYQCRQCDAPLYRSEDKFHSHCGWPSFDDEIEGAVRREVDQDGRRIEILCAQCDGHLGHVFEGEGLTDNNIRHCVNSVSMKFVSSEDSKQSVEPELAKAYFAGGCFWGVEHLLQQVDGVSSVISGYMGGHVDNPEYREVCGKGTGHIETVEVQYDASKVEFETLAKLFFEIHDPTQADGQGPDIGPQYLSAIFYNDEQEKRTAEKLIEQLNGLGYNVATQLKSMCRFWPAEDYHQDYYEKKGQSASCHFYTKRFPDQL